MRPPTEGDNHFLAMIVFFALLTFLSMLVDGCPRF